METGLQQFVRLLRLSGIRVSVAETVDAMRAAAQPGMLGDRATLREALRLTLIKDRRDDPAFDELFTAFFALARPHPAEDRHDHDHDHGHDEPCDTGGPQLFTLSETSQAAQPGHGHGPPQDIRDYFDPRDFSQRYNRHQEANRIDLSAPTREIVLARSRSTSAAAASVGLEAGRLRSPGMPGRLSRSTGLRVGTELAVAGSWNGRQAGHSHLEEEPDSALPRDRSRAADRLAELLAQHFATLAELAAAVGSRAADRAEAEAMDEEHRQELEESLRRLARPLSGALTATRRNTRRGRVHPARTMRCNMRYDGIPFRPVTTTRAEDSPRLLVLADVSLSVRATARFTLRLVRGLQSLSGQVRSFAFVDEPREITKLFAEEPLERAFDLVFSGLPGGGVLDVNADSDYGRTFELMLAEHRSVLTRKTTLLVLGDGRGNGHDPRVDAFEELTGRLRRTIWLTPEPRYSWGLGRCDLPAYAERCDQVHVVTDPAALVRVAHRMAQEVTGR
ncbi:VWA domain-containing protein [Dactylosporangium sp. NPDC049140]|uniref:VWA domain-containing protein n=1 Tax=Dactylosporangium sp. NPDC049140 TaxID=3155647 RepID=UPI0033D723E1